MEKTVGYDIASPPKRPIATFIPYTEHIKRVEESLKILKDANNNKQIIQNNTQLKNSTNSSNYLEGNQHFKVKNSKDIKDEINDNNNHFKTNETPFGINRGNQIFGPAPGPVNNIFSSKYNTTQNLNQNYKDNKVIFEPKNFKDFFGINKIEIDSKKHIQENIKLNNENIYNNKDVKIDQPKFIELKTDQKVKQFKEANKIYDNMTNIMNMNIKKDKIDNSLNPVKNLNNNQFQKLKNDYENKKIENENCESFSMSPIKTKDNFMTLKKINTIMKHKNDHKIEENNKIEKNDNFNKQNNQKEDDHNKLQLNDEKVDDDIDYEIKNEVIPCQSFIMPEGFDNSKLYTGYNKVYDTNAGKLDKNKNTFKVLTQDYTQSKNRNMLFDESNKNTQSEKDVITSKSTNKLDFKKFTISNFNKINFSDLPFYYFDEQLNLTKGVKLFILKYRKADDLIYLYAYHYLYSSIKNLEKTKLELVDGNDFYEINAFRYNCLRIWLTHSKFASNEFMNFYKLDRKNPFLFKQALYKNNFEINIKSIFTNSNITFKVKKSQFLSSIKSSPSQPTLAYIHEQLQLLKNDLIDQELDKFNVDLKDFIKNTIDGWFRLGAYYLNKRLYGHSKWGNELLGADADHSRYKDISYYEDKDDALNNSSSNLKAAMPKRKPKTNTKSKPEGDGALETHQNCSLNIQELMVNEPKKKSIIEEIREVRVDTIINKAENATNTVSDGIVKEAEDKQKKKRKQRQKKKMEGETESNPAVTTDNKDSKGENDTSNVQNISKLDKTNTSAIQNTSNMDNSVVDNSMSAVGTDQKPKRVVPRKLYNETVIDSMEFVDIDLDKLKKMKTEDQLKHLAEKKDQQVAQDFQNKLDKFEFDNYISDFNNLPEVEKAKIPKTKKLQLYNHETLLKYLGLDATELPNVSNCVKSAIANLRIDLSGPHQLDSIVAYVNCTHCDAHHRLSLRQLLYQPTKWKPGNDLPLQCTNCKKGYAVSGLCKGKPKYTDGMELNHCSQCPNYGTCIGQWTEKHCDKCKNGGSHFYGGVEGEKECPKHHN